MDTLKPTNRIEINGNEIKVNDINTPIKINVLDVDGNRINLRNNINYFRLTKDDEHYVEVTDITFNDNDIIFKLPPMKKGLYKLEIKDNNGSIYPAGEDLKILLRESFEGLKETTYKSMSDHILEEIEPIILYHIEHNPEKFRGQDGQDGKDGVDGYTPIKGVDYFDGVDGQDGIDGQDGYTPIKGVDYFDGVDGQDGQDGQDGVDGDGIVYNSENMIRTEYPRLETVGNITIVDGVETFSSTGASGVTHIQYEHQFKLSSEHVYTISFDVLNDGVVDMDHIWIINTDGTHSNYAIHTENRHIESNLFDVPQNERFRCFVTFKPQIDLVGHVRVGSSRNAGNTGKTQISLVSLSQSYDMGYRLSIEDIKKVITHMVE